MPRTGSILIVDSEPPLLDLLIELLTDEGYSVLTASNSASAFCIILNYTPALLLLDLRMPGVQGSELITQLRGAGMVATPIVLMSTNPNVGGLHVLGVVRCLAKPFDIDEMLNCVAEYVQPFHASAVSLGTRHPCRSVDLNDRSEVASSL